MMKREATQQLARPLLDSVCSDLLQEILSGASGIVDWPCLNYPLDTRTEEQPWAR
jgi:hypothetical protein